MKNNQAIIAALQKLDPSNDNHWTGDGLPRLDTVKLNAGDQSLTREDVTKAWPEFSRSNVTPAPQAPVQATPNSAAPVTPAATPSATDAAQAALAKAQVAVTGLFQPQSFTEALAASLDSEVDLDEDDFEGRIAQGRLKVEQIGRIISEAKKALDAANAELDDVINAKHAANPQDSGTMNYLAAQQRRFQERADQQIKFKESGITLKMLEAIVPKKAPIDRAMARNTTRGTQRPGS